MPPLGGCEHCGAPNGTTTERMYFELVGRALELELCEWCHQEFLAEDSITTPVPNA